MNTFPQITPESKDIKEQIVQNILKGTLLGNSATFTIRPNHPNGRIIRVIAFMEMDIKE